MPSDLRPPPDFLHPLACFALFAMPQTFLQHKEELFKLLRPDSHMYTYMKDFVFGPK